MIQPHDDYSDSSDEPIVSYKPNDYIGGYKEKSTECPRFESRRAPGRSASYSRPGDFMAGGSMSALNLPRRKTIDPKSVFGKK